MRTGRTADGALQGEYCFVQYLVGRIACESCKTVDHRKFSAMGDFFKPLRADSDMQDAMIKHKVLPRPRLVEKVRTGIVKVKESQSQGNREDRMIYTCKSRIRAEDGLEDEQKRSK